MPAEPWKVEKCNSIFNGLTGNIETHVDAVHLDYFEPLQVEEKTSIALFIESKLLEVRWRPSTFKDHPLSIVWIDPDLSPIRPTPEIFQEYEGDIYSKTDVAIKIESPSEKRLLPAVFPEKTLATFIFIWNSLSESVKDFKIEL